MRTYAARQEADGKLVFKFRLLCRPRPQRGKAAHREAVVAGHFHGCSGQTKQRN